MAGRQAALNATPGGDMTDKVQSDAVMWGILKAVGVLALVGLVVGMCVNMGEMDFSSGLSRDRGKPVVVLVTNTTPDSLVFKWSTKEGALNGTSVVPPHSADVCERFDARADVGKPYRASFEVRNETKGRQSVFSSAWLAVTGTAVWVDTVRENRRQTVKAVNDWNYVAAHSCPAY